MALEEKHYLAYMLRLWQVDDADHSHWRASLESPHTGERCNFVDLETLFVFLRDRTITSSTAGEERAELGRGGDEDEN
jgi:hypothetical protein